MRARLFDRRRHRNHAGGQPDQRRGRPARGVPQRRGEPRVAGRAEPRSGGVADARTAALGRRRRSPRWRRRGGFPPCVVRPDLRAPGADAGGLAGGAAAGAGAGGGSSVAVPAHHRAGHRVRGAASRAARSCCRTATRRPRCTRPRTRKPRASGWLAYEVSNYARTGRGKPAQPGLLALRRLCRHRAGRAWADHARTARCSRRGATAHRSRGPSASSATATARTEEIGARRVERAREMLLMGLRLSEGIEATRFRAHRDGTGRRARSGHPGPAVAEGYLHRDGWPIVPQRRRDGFGLTRCLRRCCGRLIFPVSFARSLCPRRRVAGSPTGMISTLSQGFHTESHEGLRRATNAGNAMRARIDRVCHPIETAIGRIVVTHEAKFALIRGCLSKPVRGPSWKLRGSPCKTVFENVPIINGNRPRHASLSRRDIRQSAGWRNICRFASSSPSALKLCRSLIASARAADGLASIVSSNRRRLGHWVSASSPSTKGTSRAHPHSAMSTTV